MTEDEIDHRTRVSHADRTSTLIAALKMLEGIDFETMMGSGIMVQLTPITPERRLAGEFMLAAEDMKEIAPLFAKSIRNMLELRTVMLQRELGDINNVLGKEKQ